MKTIVAFANTQGGKLIVGVDDRTHEIVGVENEILFQIMDGIANAVSDSCMPQIIPDIEPQTVEGKTVIVVSVEAGKNRPYYLKSKGKYQCKNCKHQSSVTSGTVMNRSHYLRSAPLFPRDKIPLPQQPCSQFYRMQGRLPQIRLFQAAAL